MSDVNRLDGENENLIEAALTQAFTAPPSRRASLQAQVDSDPTSDTKLDNAAEGTVTQPAAASMEGGSASSDDSWKAEYESQVESWRAQSAEAREKAEKERLRWEAVRAAEREEAARRKAEEAVSEPIVPREEHGEAGWETVSNAQSHSLVSLESDLDSPSPADARDLVADEPQKKGTPALADSITLPPAEVTVDDSHKWEDVQSSMASSFPSMSFPERTETPSPSQPLAASAPPLSATLAIFDSSLSVRTRVTALFSSLAINMLLPFVNGVMLGFGEIFAKNVVMGWLGWKPRSGSTATTAGIGISTPWGQR